MEKAHKTFSRVHGSARRPADERELSGGFPEEALLGALGQLGEAVGPGDVMRLTGVDRQAAENLLCGFVARHGGDIQATDDGAVVYRLPRRRRARTRALPAVWERQALAPAVQPAAARVDWMYPLMSFGFLLVSAVALLRTMVRGGAWPAALVIFIASALALGVPLSRLLGARALQRRAALQSGRHWLLREVLERTPGVVLEAYALSHAWIEATGRPIGPAELIAEMRALGGEVDVACDGRLLFRFPDLDHEARALDAERRRSRN